MKKTMGVLLLALGLSCLTTASFAGPVADSVKAGMGEARENLLSLLETADKAEQAKKIEAIKAATAKVDAIVAANAADFAAFSEVFVPFKKTRDGEIVPMILAGKVDEAKGLGKGIQAERYKKMMEILGGVAK
ncbi:MAG: hypothetical protein HQM06_17270 [Magnetococcales bacterium]|nr:hypothetical protein [Magnetococcales bacterium]